MEINTEQSILEAAERLFLSKGYATVSTTEIAKEAGCNQALVHYYYRTKERLFEAIFEKKAQLLIQNFINIKETEGSFEEKLRKRILSHFELLRDNPKLPFLLINEFTINPERITNIKKSLGNLPIEAFKQFSQELEIEIQAGRVRHITPFELILMVLSLNAGLFLFKPVFLQINGMNEKDYLAFIDRREEEYIQMILQYIRP